MINLDHNPNTRAARLFVSALADCGLEAVCIAPGSRSTPLTLAFAQEPRITLYRHLDERSAGYFALGLAKASDKPAALVCTSGTAAANFHPAVVEARYGRVPLLVLTADRPPELRETGANQTIDQVKMFGDHVLWAVDMPVPQSDSPPNVDRYVQSVAARAFFLANGQPAGPVHVNLPFRKPLEPSPVTTGPAQSLPLQTGTLAPLMVPPLTGATSGEIRQLAEIVEQHPHGLIVCGPESPSRTYSAAVEQLASASGFPVLADALSGVRTAWADSGATIMAAYDALLQAQTEALPTADLVIRFGAVPTSAALNRYLAALPDTTIIQVSHDGVWADDTHRTARFVHSDEAALCFRLAEQLTAANFIPDRRWADTFGRLEREGWAALDATLAETPETDAAVVCQLVNDELPRAGTLFVGNSLPVRLVDQLLKPTHDGTWIAGNRGASGIDGNVSTALGLAAARGEPVYALLGDITFYHDMNGLLAGRLNDIPPVTFIVLNNNGGGIFRRLPVAAYESEATDLFVMPHGLTFQHAAQLYGLSYVRLTASEFRANKGRLFEQQKQSTLIEIVTDSQKDLAVQQRIATTIRERLERQELFSDGRSGVAAERLSSDETI